MDGRRTLLIEDDPSAADAATRLLREIGHATEVAPTVDAAFAALAGGEYDLVVLDLLLDRDPAALHDALARRRVPVLVVSGREPERLPAVAKPRGWGWLAKPYEPDVFVTSVDRALGRATGEQRAAVSSITRDADGRAAVAKSTAQIVSETAVDFAALGIMGAALLLGRVTHPILQGLLVVGILLLAGIRAADLIAISKGIPGRGGPGALLLALTGAALSRLGGS